MTRQPIGNLRALERFVAQCKDARSGYLTLARVDPDRRERQVERIELSRHRADGWLRRLVGAEARAHRFVRLRLRRWDPGGKARGSVTFTVGTPTSKPAKPSSAPPVGDVDRLQRQLTTLRTEHTLALERIEQLESVVAEMVPIVDAAKQILLAIGTDEP